MPNQNLFSSLEPEQPMPEHRYGFLVIGPHASGKTTAARAACAGIDTSRVRVVHADNGNWAATAGGEQRLRDLWFGPVGVLVIEGALMVGKLARVLVGETSPRRHVEWLQIATTPDVMEAHIRARCVAAGKAFRQDVWTPRALAAHCYRHDREIARHFAMAAITRWPMDSAYTGAPSLVSHLRGRITEALG